MDIPVDTRRNIQDFPTAMEPDSSIQDFHYQAELTSEHGPVLPK